MRIYGITRVKDEADVIRATIEHMLGQVDNLIVQDNNSSDGTWEILHELVEQHGTNRLVVFFDPEVAYYQAGAMTHLASVARGWGAEWIVPFDADELWVAAGGGTVRDWLEHMDPEVAIVEADLYDHVVTAEDDREERDPTWRIGFRRQHPAPLGKVAGRAAAPLRIHQGNHDGHHASGRAGGLMVHHYPYRSIEQFVRKVRNGAAAYAATDLPEHVGQHWRDYGRLTDEQLDEVFTTWHSFGPDSQAAGVLVHDVPHEPVKP